MVIRARSLIDLRQVNLLAARNGVGDGFLIKTAGEESAVHRAADCVLV